MDKSTIAILIAGLLTGLCIRPALRWLAPRIYRLYATAAISYGFLVAPPDQILSRTNEHYADWIYAVARFKKRWLPWHARQ